MNTNFEIHFNQNNDIEDIDERLFDLNLTEDKHNSNSKALADISSLSSEEESDSSSQKTLPSVTHQQCKKNSRKNMKSCKKDEVIINESDNESTKNSKKSEANGENEKKQKSLYKTELCRNWEETNHCRYGMKCQYAHGASDLREIDRHPKYKTQKCRTFHQTGSCPYGARCTFRHFNLPGDALEMNNLDKQEKEEEEQKKKQEQELKEKEDLLLKEKEQPKEERSSIFSMDNQKLLSQHWFLNTNSPIVNLNDSSYKRSTMFDPEDSLLPSNAESLLPHQLLFDLESPDDEEEKPARCPLRDYVNLPSFSSFQVPYHSQHNTQHHQQHQQQQQQEQCKTFFRPWLF